MMQAVDEALVDPQVVLYMTDANRSPYPDLAFLRRHLHQRDVAVFWLLNKTDRMEPSRLLPLIADYPGKDAFAEVLPLSAAERALLNEGDMDDADWEAMVGAPADWGEPGYSRVERMGARPTLEINGIAGGYSGDGFKTVIPAQARAKISCRLVAGQRPARIYQLVCDYIRAIAPPTVEMSFELFGQGDPVQIDVNSPVVQALRRAYSLHWPRAAQYRRIGGTVPAVAMIQEVLGVTGVPLGFSTGDSGIHGPNEFYRVDMLYKGIDTTVRFLQEIARGHGGG